jgi:hypothetical protein
MTVHYTEAEIRSLIKSKAEQIVSNASRGYIILRGEVDSLSALVECLPERHIGTALAAYNDAVPS